MTPQAVNCVSEPIPLTMAANAEAILKLFVGGLVWTERLEGRMAAARGTIGLAMDAGIGTMSLMSRGVPITVSSDGWSLDIQPVIVSFVEHS